MNPFLKTLLGNAAGFLALTVDHAIGNPTGGLATYLGAHADVATLYVGAYTLVHNWITVHYPPASH